MDNNQQFRPYSQIELQSFRAMRKATLFFFIALGTMLLGTMVLPYIFATLCIVFAYLAKAKQPKSNRFCKTLIVLSVVILIMNTIYTIFAIYTVTSNPDYIKQINDLYQQMYGTSMDGTQNTLSYPSLTQGGLTK
ncbi:MAG: hypothetical protein IKI20_04965 [Lachnospiraceae bacterium]|nr:hypothetical protein [Lachnospiraceae bacterium]